MVNTSNNKKQIVLDIEADNRYESELEEPKKLLQASLINLPIGVYIVQDGKFQFVSSQFQQITGYGEDGLRGHNSLEIVFPEDRRVVRENVIKI